VIGRLVHELTQFHSVALAYLRAHDEPPMEEALAERCALVKEVPRPGMPKDMSRSARRLKAWVRGVPIWVEDWRVPSFGTCLRQLVEEWRPQVVQFEFHTMAQYVADAWNCPTVLVEHEPGAAAARDRWLLSRGWRPFLGRDARSWEAYEQTNLEKFDAVVCFTDRDRRTLLRLAPNERVEVISPCGPSLVSPVSKEAESNDTVLFVGNFVHPPNVDAAVWLTKRILPQVWTRHPKAVLQLVGAAPPFSVRRLATSRVLVTGTVPDVAPYLTAATVVLAPLRMGGGIRIKVMDALALGKAVVATPLAAEGLGVSDGQELLMAEGEQAFADAVSRTLSDAQLRQSLSQNARRWAARFGEPARVGAAFERLYESLSLPETKP